MNKKEKILAMLLVSVLIFSVGLTYHKTIIKKDFEAVNMDIEPINDEIVEETIL